MNDDRQSDRRAPSWSKARDTSMTLRTLEAGVRETLAYGGQPMMAEVEAVTGRVVLRNRMGRLLFLRLLPGDEPMTWEEVEQGGPYDGLRQVYVKRDVVGEAAWNDLVSVDLGIVVTCSGPTGHNRAGEPYVEAHTVLMGDAGVVR